MFYSANDYPMLKLCLFSILLIFPSIVYSQFITVRIIKPLPSVQIAEPTDTLKQGRAEPPSPGPAAAPRLQVSMPLHLPIINSPYGARPDPITGEFSHHKGIDFRARQDSVLSIMPGKVKKVGYSQGLGNYTEVEHEASRSIYGHLSVVFVRESMDVSAGEAIAITGDTGRSTGEHLHFAIRHRGRIVNPTPYLDLIYRRIKMSNRITAPLSSLRQPKLWESY